MGLPVKNGRELAYMLGFGKEYDRSKQAEMNDDMQQPTVEITRITQNELKRMVTEATRQVMEAKGDVSKIVNDTKKAAKSGFKTGTSIGDFFLDVLRKRKENKEKEKNKDKKKKKEDEEE